VNIAYNLSGGLSSSQLEQVRELVKSILLEIGVEIDHDEIRAFLGRQPGVKVQGKRVCYSGERVEQALLQQGKQNGDYVWQWPGEPDWTMRPAYMCLNVYDALTGQIRRSRLADVPVAAQLCDSYDMAGTCPVHAQDVPAPLRQITLAKACIQNSRAVGKWMTVDNLNEIRCITEMAELAGRKGPHVILQITISPLRLNVEYLDIIWKLRGSPDFTPGVTIGGGAIPMLGATGPLGLPAAWAQAAAECIGSYITTKLIDPRVDAHACFQVFPFDMGTMAFIMGSPEGALSRLVGKQIQQFLFGRRFASSFGSLGMPLDPQSTAERASNVLLEALAGSRVFYDAGMSPMDDMFSNEQIVVDHEIMQWVRRFIQGLPFNPDNAAALAAIREGLAEGTFLTQDWSLGHREFYWRPELFRGTTLSAFMAGDGKTFAQRARDTVSARLASHHFTLGDDVNAGIERVYQKTVSKLKTT
jgi:trimethylamine:corrinoid methyltransferase-like protein